MVTAKVVAKDSVDGDRKIISAEILIVLPYEWLHAVDCVFTLAMAGWPHVVCNLPRYLQSLVTVNGIAENLGGHMQWTGHLSAIVICMMRCP